MVFYSKSTEETKEIGKKIAEMLETHGGNRKFIALRGEMGVGKTAFTAGFAGFFGIDGVRSPTYTVVNEYGTKNKIYHFDMYRITDGDDLYSIGYDDYLESGGYLIVEWSENIQDYIPEDRITVIIERVSENEGHRRITVDLD